MDLGQRNKVSVTGNMSSMTDLVFLLLIFFVILSTLASKGVNVDLPQSKGVTSQASKLTVSITKD
ncbi:MAG: biopolymer transporter ExbD, partial [Flavobacteriales bacterium]|nr:biopolymer transporter ExbD [Flavobacteriales bacterium]